MQSEIQGELLKAKNERKRVRRNKIVYVLIFVGLSLLFFVMAYSQPETSAPLYGLDALTIFLGAVYILFNAGPAIYQPLSREKYAFIQIFEALEILYKSKDAVAYEEAYKYLEKADQSLDGQLLDPLKWYERINQSLLDFRGNLKFIVLPSTSALKIKTEHLEEMALALSIMDPARIMAINQKLGTEPTYVRETPQPRKPLLTMLKESKYGKMGFSLGLGFF